MSIQLARRLIHADEYYKMAEAGILTEKDHVELIHGEIIEMSPKGNKHASIVLRLTNVLKDIVGNAALINVQHPIRINDLNEPEPDLTILKPKGDYYASAHPIPNDVFIVVEVADTTYEYDRQIKLPLYSEAEIPEYWLVNSGKNEIEVYRLPAKGAYKKMEIFYPEDLLKLSFCNKTVEVSKLLG